MHVYDPEPELEPEPEPEPEPSSNFPVPQPWFFGLISEDTRYQGSVYRVRIPYPSPLEGYFFPSWDTPKFISYARFLALILPICLPLNFHPPFLYCHLSFSFRIFLLFLFPLFVVLPQMTSADIPSSWG